MYPNLCDMIDIDEVSRNFTSLIKDKCYYDFGISLKDGEVCNKIQDDDYKSSCCNYIK